MEVVVTTGAKQRLQSNRHHKQTLPVAQPTATKHWMEILRYAVFGIYLSAPFFQRSLQLKPGSPKISERRTWRDCWFKIFKGWTPFLLPGVKALKGYVSILISVLSNFISCSFMHSLASSHCPVSLSVLTAIFQVDLGELVPEYLHSGFYWS